MKQVTNTTEFIIGIDFGHGETSASYHGLHDKTDFKDLEILPGKKVIPSAVAILEDEGREKICVGEAAVANAGIAKDFQISFKKRPSEMNKVERKRMVAFMKGVYAGILDKHPDFVHREHVVYIARPSQSVWDAEERAYIQIAEEAGLPVAGIQKESRAAYFRARTQGGNKIDSYVKEGVLIVDFGSSTIDFTYLNARLTKPIDDGRPLGANEVEMALMKYAMEHPTPTDNVIGEFAYRFGWNRESIPYNQMLFAFRKAKEGFYSNMAQPKFSIALDYFDLTSSEKDPLEGYGGFSINRNDVNKILSKEGYINRVKDAVKVFKEERLKGQKVALVYLTGGASRMDFVRETFMEMFNLDKVHCPSDDNPSLIVSQGVANLSYADIRTEGKADELKREAQEIILAYGWENALKQIIWESVKNSIIGKAKMIMQNYRDGIIGEYLELKDEKTPAGEYVGMQPGKSKNGFTLIRNIRALNERFLLCFNDFVRTDFVSECESIITKNLIDSVVEVIKNKFSEFEYTSSMTKHLKLSGLSAKLTQNGARRLSERFTDGEGCIIYEAVKSCYPGGAMVGWNLHKDRWDSDRKQHYDYYTAHYEKIFPNGNDAFPADYLWNRNSWAEFLEKEVVISGIDSAKQQTMAYVNDLIDDYISYARLAQFLV